MASFTTSGAQAMLKALLTGTDLTGAGEILNGLDTYDFGSGAVPSLWVSFHTIDPGEAPVGEQAQSEVSGVAYVDYARQPLKWGASGHFTITTAGSPARSVGWSNQQITFPTAGASSSGTVTCYGVGTKQSANGKLIWRGPLVDSAATWIRGSIDTTGTGHVCTAYSHGFSNDDAIFIYPMYDGTPMVLPAQGTVYYAEALSVDTIRFHQNSGVIGTPSPINVSAVPNNGSVRIIKAATLATTDLSTNPTPNFPANSLGVFQT